MRAHRRDRQGGATAIGLGRPEGSLLAGAATTLDRAAVVLTPARALAAVTLGAALLLGASQFADYRGVAVGADQYLGVEAVAPAPEVGRERAGEAHLWLLLPAAGAAIVALGLALRSRWRLCRLIAAIGVAGIVTSLAIDLPAALDAGVVARDFEGAEARLLGGFWAQLLAASLLAASSLLLARELGASRVAEDAAPPVRSREEGRGR